MQSFVTRHQSQVKGVLSGLDRVRFRGTLRLLANSRGLLKWLSHRSILLKDFKKVALDMTETIRQATHDLAERAGRPVVYLPSSSVRKEDRAREIAARDQITEGLVCVLTAVEPCQTFTVGPRRETKRLELRHFHGKCLHQYFYLIDPQWGWLNVRVQTWLPFTAHVVINGREWLACELRKRGLGYEQRDNCFVDLADVERTQRLMDRQLKIDWSQRLNRLLRQVHPAHRLLFGEEPLLSYYWSADETEWATDVMFRSRDALAALYPRLIQHAVTSFGGNDVLRFLGRRPSVQRFTAGELLSHLATRPEGTRIKHALDRNSIKMYDKQETVLRVETTINNPRQMKSYRASETDPDGPRSWRPLRKGVADLHRRTELSQKANERYLEALATVDAEPTLAQTTAPVCQRTEFKGRSARALNPLANEDARLLEVVSQGEFTLHGFRNRDLQKPLFADHQHLTSRQQMAKVTRLIRLLRAHHLVQKVPRTHRYMLTPEGRTIITALLAARAANTRQLTDLAA